MNDTKWRELRLLFRALRPSPEFRTRDVIDQPIQPSLWEGDWDHFEWPYAAVEWMEIRPTVGCDLSPIEAVLRRVGTTFERLDDRVRVYGYTRAGDPPAREAGGTDGGITRDG